MLKIVKKRKKIIMFSVAMLIVVIAGAVGYVLAADSGPVDYTKHPSYQAYRDDVNTINDKYAQIKAECMEKYNDSFTCSRSQAEAKIRDLCDAAGKYGFRVPDNWPYQY